MQIQYNENTIQCTAKQETQLRWPPLESGDGGFTVCIERAENDENDKRVCNIVYCHLLTHGTSHASSFPCQIVQGNLK